MPSGSCDGDRTSDNQYRERNNYYGYNATHDMRHDIDECVYRWDDARWGKRWWNRSCYIINNPPWLRKIVLLYIVLGSFIGDSMNSAPTQISVSSWNMRCNFSCAGPYLNTLARKADVIVVAEHGLYTCELYKFDRIIQGYRSIAKASKRLNDANMGHKRGQGGCAIVWNCEKLKFKVRPLPKLGSDRMCVI